MAPGRRSLTVNEDPSAPPLLTSHSLEVWFDTNLNKIRATLALHTSLKFVTQRSKPWRTETLSAHRKGYNSSLGALKRDCHDSSLLMSARAPRSYYFQAIMKAKRDHWCEFLSKATPQRLWTAKKFAIGRPPSRFQELPGASTPLEINKTLLDHFFAGCPIEVPHTILLHFKDVLALEASEIARALARSSPLSAPGPDKTPNLVWKRFNKVAPALHS